MMNAFDAHSPHSVLVMDNFHSPHSRSQVTAFANWYTCTVLPPYSPDLNPTEEAFSNVKLYLCHHDELIMQARGDHSDTINRAF